MSASHKLVFRGIVINENEIFTHFLEGGGSKMLPWKFIK